MAAIYPQSAHKQAEPAHKLPHADTPPCSHLCVAMLLQMRRLGSQACGLFVKQMWQLSITRSMLLIQSHTLRKLHLLDFSLRLRS